jgi:hypothetical protein
MRIDAGIEEEQVKVKSGKEEGQSEKWKEERQKGRRFPLFPFTFALYSALRYSPRG